jgi:hypothetical protein
LSAQAPRTQGVLERLQDTSPDERRRWWLWGVLALAVLGLGGLARALMKDLSTSKPLEETKGRSRVP